MEQLEDFWTKKCKVCDVVRPARAYHCFICDTCTLMKDHHQPFINNCVGLENYRYFLLFCVYLQIGLYYVIITFGSIRSHYLFKQHYKLMNGLTAIDVVICIALMFFGSLNYFAALFGSTTIELWKNRGIGKNKDEARLRFEFLSDNLYRIFGTHKFFRIFSPSFRNVPFTGLEWSFKL